MKRKRQNNQKLLAFMEGGSGETRSPSLEGSARIVIEHGNGGPETIGPTMEEVCTEDNRWKAMKTVQANKGSPGSDGMTVGKLGEHLEKHWPEIRAQLLSGTYKPQPVKRVEIPKPDGGVRKLGIPTVLDRFVQQMVMQVLQGRWDRTFSASSFGFRPGRSAHQAVAQAQTYIAEGHGWVVDLDLEKFFDRVNHDKLMGLVSNRIQDRRLRLLIQAFLKAGVLEGGLVSPSEEGTPQGGPLSPLLSNLVLDVLDRELEKRGHRFVRYADDCNIYVRSERAGQRVMKSVKHFIEKKLKLKVNEAKSAVARPSDRKFLGFTFTSRGQLRRRIAPKALERFRVRVRKLTRRTAGIGFKEMVAKLATYLRGWGGYFGFCQTPGTLTKLNGWIRRRLRCIIWRAWKTNRKRFAELLRRGVGRDLVAQAVASPKGIWRISHSPALDIAFPDAFFEKHGLPRLRVQ